MIIKANIVSILAPSLRISSIFIIPLEQARQTITRGSCPQDSKPLCNRINFMTIPSSDLRVLQATYHKRLQIPS